MELTSSMALVADATADVDATVDADASNYLIWGCLKRQPLYINYYYVPSYIFHLFIYGILFFNKYIAIVLNIHINYHIIIPFLYIIWTYLLIAKTYRHN